jgi:hypothetical protein
LNISSKAENRNNGVRALLQKKSEMIKSFQSINRSRGHTDRVLIFFHPDFTVGFGVTPNHALRLVGFTTGRESHPALKIIFNYDVFYAGPRRLSSRSIGAGCRIRNLDVRVFFTKQMEPNTLLRINQIYDP